MSLKSDAVSLSGFCGVKRLTGEAALGVAEGRGFGLGRAADASSEAFRFVLDPLKRLDEVPDEVEFGAPNMLGATVALDVCCDAGLFEVCEGLFRCCFTSSIYRRNIDV